MAGAAVQLLPSAGADEIVVRQVASSEDSGVIDLNRDGVAEYNRYGVTNQALSVGEQPGDGNDLRLMVPFTVSATALDAVRNGGYANVALKVWRVSNLGARSLVVDAYTDIKSLTKADYSRASKQLTALKPVEGRLAVDVTDQLRSMPAPGMLTLRLRLDQLAPQDGIGTQVNIATSESRDAANRPVLSVSSKSPAATVPTVPAIPETIPPSLPPATTPTVPTTTPTIPPVTAPAPPTAAQPPAGVTGGATWDPIFNDDFDGTAVDTANWNVQNNSNYGSGNHEDECYKAANTTVAGGVLKLTGKRETVTGCGTNPDGGSNYFFTSGMVTTRAQGGAMKFKYRHGYAEVRMRVPRGNIYWPAFWLVGAGDGSSPGWPDYGEIDVVEIYGSNPDTAESNFHRPGGNIGAKGANVNSVGSYLASVNINPPKALLSAGTNSFHTYGINWTANKLEWYIDGVLVRSHTATSADTAALGYEHSIILNLAMGGNGPRYPGHGYTGIESGGGYSDGNLSADLPGSMDIDYVRVWQP